MRNRFLLAFLFLTFLGQAQTDSTLVASDTAVVEIPENGLKNPNAIMNFWQKLLLLQKTKSGKVNIVHIGDSHIQADLMTAKIRRNLQSYFGNGGRGFVFPHKLAKTNGSWDIRFSSDDNWENRKNVSVFNGSPIGLSGIMLRTKLDDFSILLDSKSYDNKFNSIKIITPNNENSFAVAVDKKTVSTTKKVNGNISHTIKKGETLSDIAEKYDVSVSELKKLNRLKSERIRSGKKLKIQSEQIKTIQKSVFEPLALNSDENCHFINFEKNIDEIYLLPSGKTNDCVLSGIVLENNDSGILYHNIGVNGAQFSNYNKYPLFFEQLNTLQPDLIVVSLGTNESFGKKSTDEYIKDLDLFLQNVKKQNPNVEFLISTPPPSSFKGRIPNKYVADYSQKLLKTAEEKNFTVWDLYAQFGGYQSVERNFRAGLMAKDRVHYSKSGYEKQGDLLSEALLKTFENFKTLQN